MLLTIALVSVFWLVIFFSLLSLINNKQRIDSNISTSSVEENFNQSKPELLRERTFEELSPDGQKKIVRYKVSYQPQLFSNNHTTYLNNEIIVAVINDIQDGDNGREYYLFNGEERTGDPHWLGNRYVFFTAYCGTSCQGLILLDTQSKQIWKGVHSNRAWQNEKPQTHFSDWFDEEFEFPGLIDKIHAEMINNKPYLIFDMINDKEVESGQKRFLFTGNSLILER